MARTSKLPRYREFNQAENAFGERAQDPHKIKEFFEKDKFVLELGCGKAELSMALAEKYPKRQFVGVDLKADRLWRPSKNALEAGLKNIVFLQSDIRDLQEVFGPGSAEEIWITFPDPFPKKRQAKHRMLNKNFLDIYAHLLGGSKLKFKTDNLELFHWSLETLADYGKFKFEKISFDLHDSDIDGEAKIKTTYEKKFIAEGLKINYLEGSFSL